MNKLLLLAGLLVSSSVFAQTYTMPVRVNQDKSLRADRAPIMKLDHSGNIYVSWVGGADASGNGDLNMAVSTDGGATFAESVVSADAKCNSNFQRGGEFVVDTKGNIHLVWVAGRVGTQPDVWYTRSTDKGKTWSMAMSISDADDSSKYAQDFPSIACDSSDNLYVSYLDPREKERKQSAYFHLYVTRSTNGGMNWSAHKKADVLPSGIGGTCECCAEHIASSPDGHLFIVFRSNINNVRDIWMARSNDKALTFEPALKVMNGDWNIADCPVTGPNIAVDDSNGAHIVWRDSRDDNGGAAHLFYAYVPSGSMQTPMNMMIDASGAQTPNYPNISVYDHHRFVVMTYETFNYGMRYILNANGSPLVNNRPIDANGTSAKSFSNVLFAANGTRYLCWQDAMSDKGDIYFAKETSPLPTSGVAISPMQTGFSIYPNPISKANPTFTITHQASTTGSLQIVDMLGREIVRQDISGQAQTNITLPQIPSGTYFVVTRTADVVNKALIVVE